MALTKSQRQNLFNRFGGKCAYCGCDLPLRWHADHFEPVERAPDYSADNPFKTWKPTRPDRDVISNMMPSCPPCNIDKHSMNLESWRTWLQTRLEALCKTPGFKLLSAHGLVKTTGAPIVFHFERLERAAGVSAGTAPNWYTDFVDQQIADGATP